MDFETFPLRPDKEIVEQLCAYSGLETVESFHPVAFQAHFGGVGRITRATLKYRRHITNHVFRVRRLVALEQADSRGRGGPSHERSGRT